MRIRTLTASVLIAAASLTGCALSNTEPAAASIVHEESPEFDCLTDGNQVCGAVMADDATLAAAWQEWDSQQGYRSLRVDPSREFRVVVDAYSRAELKQIPGTVVLTDTEGMRYRFAVDYPAGS